jgi:tRNA threonylcarbamoyladenosine biosynthesis protein TsaB
MKILILDTCGATGNIALADTARQPNVMASASLPGRTASERLVATIRGLVASAGIELRSLGSIVVVSGPGSFTGVRVGLSAAKGLCEALDVPLVAISRLAVLAHVAAAKDATGSQVFALLDAGRGEVYLGHYAGGTLVREALVTRQQLIEAVEAARTGLGARGASIRIVTCEAALAESFAELAPQLVAEPTAQDALALALPRIEAGDFDDAVTLDANYLRRTDAEIFAKASAAPNASGTAAQGGVSQRTETSIR